MKAKISGKCNQPISLLLMLTIVIMIT
jgi:hypothetical protein